MVFKRLTKILVWVHIKPRDKDTKNSQKIKFFLTFSVYTRAQYAEKSKSPRGNHVVFVNNLPYICTVFPIGAHR